MRGWRGLALVLLIAFLLPGGVVAQGLGQPDGGLRQEYAPSRSGGISLDQAVRRVAERTDGRVLSARTIRRGGREIHQVRVLVAQGRVRVFDVDARSGEIR
ncbi:PepSY domain-containing protein [Sediminicurvatus halobius]|uniref:PepSY domain-containing protein n=1 Tax=Sediminicurvatus halobius TaxID=2182432 RepID=A0A2U2N5P1_9GAMM|nr:PepSY domain-containing protein [Spiribacter halobius]PWG64304.1 hypothetical protein DEM34_05315 [Spiribacter halobius]UEX79354.1 hypothetical protein LMH63_06860 [Spiribacter halobius]